MNQQYQQTGKSIPIQVPELISFVHNKLDQYVALTNATQMKPDFDPFSDPLIFTTQEGKLIQIPKDIQKQAVASWKQNHNEQDQQPQLDLSGEIGGPGGMSQFGHLNMANTGAPLESTSHMAHMRGQLPPTHQHHDHNYDQNDAEFVQNQDYDTQSADYRTSQEHPQHQHHYPQQRPYHQQYMPPVENVVIVEKKNNTMYILLFVLVLAAIGYYYYKKNRFTL